MEELTGQWYLRENFFGGYGVYVQVKSISDPFPYFRKIKKGEEIELYKLNNKICTERN